MRHRRGVIAVKILVFLALAVAVFGAAVWALWNWLMPAIFGLPAIGFWQAVGLLVLSWILFRGGFMGWGRGFGRHRMRRRWQQMSPEERERVRKWMQERCGGGGEAQKEG